MQEASKGNAYNHNFQNKFCGCEEEYDAAQEKGTMFQCIGLGSVQTGGCGEDWWHPECLLGLPRDWHKTLENEVSNGADTAEGGVEHPIPPEFPNEDDFEAMVCYKCVESNPWIKNYAGTPGFLKPVFRKDCPRNADNGVPVTSSVSTTEVSGESTTLKRKASVVEDDTHVSAPVKRLREDVEGPSTTTVAEVNQEGHHKPHHKHGRLPPAPTGTFSLFMEEDFREHFCHCPACYGNLLPHQQLVEEEETYEPSISESEQSIAPGSGARSHGSGSILERGEAALSTMDRVKAIEGVMVYNHLKDKVKEFLKPYAESGKPVGAEDIKAYFEKLRGDDAAIKEAKTRPVAGDEDSDNRHEQSGY